MSPRAIARLGALVCVFVTASLWARTALQSSAAPFDFLDVPGSLAANADGDVYVSFATDYGAAVVRRFSADGVVLGKWEVARDDFAQHAIAEAGDGGLFVTLADADVVRRYSKDGQQTAEWPVAGLENVIATTPGTADTEVYVLTTVLGGGSAVHQFDPAGNLGASFAVDRSSYDLGVVAPSQSGGSEVIVVAGPKQLGTELSRYRLDGTKIGTWETSDGYDVAGIDVDAASGAVWIGMAQRFVEGTGGIGGYTRSGQRAAWCQLPAQPIDVTVGQNGDTYVLAFGDTDDPQRDARRQVLRYRLDPWCTLVGTWDLEQLNGLVEPTPTGPTGAPSDTPTATESGSETPTTTLVTATATPLEGYPTSATPTYAPTGTITPVATTEVRLRLWLPVVMRGGA